jgi:hypothetical protein
MTFLFLHHEITLTESELTFSEGYLMVHKRKGDAERNISIEPQASLVLQRKDRC